MFIGNSFPERSEEWLQYAGVPVTGVPFEDCRNYYKSAIVCPNIHGSWQRGNIDEFNGVPGLMINERIFQVILSGGFAISDNNPIVKKFFTEDEVPYAETKEDFKRLIEHFRTHPDERLPYMKKAKERILKEHLYTHRISKFLKEAGI
jgi:spore maturation protein CgeB